MIYSQYILTGRKSVLYTESRGSSPLIGSQPWQG